MKGSDYVSHFSPPNICSILLIDRFKAALWTKKLTEDISPQKTRTEYLKLLLFLLIKQRLQDPFVKEPPKKKLRNLKEYFTVSITL